VNTKRPHLCSVVLLWVATSSAWANEGDLVIVSPDAFSEAAVFLPLPSDVPPEASAVVPGSSAARIFRKWGVIFRGSGATAPAVKWLPGIGVNPPFNIWSIVNGGSPNSGEPMILDFDIPARRIGFRLHGEPEAGTARGYDTAGRLLGTIDLPRQPGWIGLESTGVEGISKLVVDYGDTGVAEEIDELVVEFVSGPPSFELYMPQVGDGRAVVNGQPVSLASVLRISNLRNEIGPGPTSDGVVEGVLEFFDDQGQPLLLDLDRDSETSSLEFSLDPGETLVVRTGGNSDPAKSGYARIRADGPTVATSEFTVLNGAGDILTEAGISAVEPVLRSVGGMASSLEASLDSAVALANPSPEESVTVRIRVSGAGFDQTENLSLEPGRHVAAFIRELFPSLTQAPEGSVSISAGVPIAAAILRTRHGLPLSSLQLDSLELAATP
jgi:hypothetical protein